MKAVIQRVSQATVKVDSALVASIKKGLLILVGFTHDDDGNDLEWMTRKISQLRIFDDLEGKMNLSVTDIKGDILVVSQFTLYASTKKGNRPSYVAAAAPVQALELYKDFLTQLRTKHSMVEKGVFGAMMEVGLVNDGPVTIVIDSKQNVK